jgi:PAS domain S-box-containing protein
MVVVIGRDLTLRTHEFAEHIQALRERLTIIETYAAGASEPEHLRLRQAVIELRAGVELLETAAFKSVNHDDAQRHARLRTLFDNVEDGLVLLNKDGIIIEANQAVSTLMGTPLDELLNQHWNAFASGIKAPVLHDGRTRQLRIPFTAADGEQQLFDIRVRPLFNADGGVEYICIHAVESTAQFHIDEVMMRNELISASFQIAATVAHEVNTPLQSIQNCIYLARDAANHQYDSYLALADEEIDRISQTVSRYMDSNYIDTEPPIAININRLVEQVIQIMERILTRHGVTVEYALEPSIKPIRGRTYQLKQVIINLILDAIHAMPDGGTLRVKTTQQTQPSAAVLMISDTRHTATPLERQIAAPISFPEQPMGIELFVNRRLIALHGGEISSSDVLGAGHTFTIILPTDITPSHTEI